MSVIELVQRFATMTSLLIGLMPQSNNKELLMHKQFHYEIVKSNTSFKLISLVELMQIFATTTSPFIGLMP